MEATLAAAIRAASHCERADLTAEDHIRRQINQGFFEKLFIGEDGSVVRVILTEPFHALLPEVVRIFGPSQTAAETSARPEPELGHVPRRIVYNQRGGDSGRDDHHPS